MSTQPKFTLGPWFGKKNGKYVQKRNSWNAENDGDFAMTESAPITDSEGNVVALVVYASNRYYGESPLLDANASLISAAPELYAALEPFIAHNSSDETITITVRTADVTRARAALAKAGRQ